MGTSDKIGNFSYLNYFGTAVFCYIQNSISLDYPIFFRNFMFDDDD